MVLFDLIRLTGSLSAQNAYVFFLVVVPKGRREVNSFKDTTLADRFLFNLDRPISDLRGKVKCPTCGEQITRIYLYQAGTMGWRSGSIAQPDTLATIEEHGTELREVARAKIKPTDPAFRERQGEGEELDASSAPNLKSLDPNS